MAHKLDDTLSAFPDFGTCEDVSEDLSWTRWSYGEELSDVMLRPALPDRPLVVKTRDLCIIPPGCRATFFLGVPVRVAVAHRSGQGAARSEHHEVLQVSSRALSDTWFGDFFTGQLCYSLPAMAAAAWEELDLSPLDAACAFTIFNQSESDLPLKQICVDVSQLAIYLAKGRLWANEVFVSYKGEDEPARVRFGGGPPKSLGPPSLMRPASAPADQSLLQRTLRFNFRSS